MELYNEIASSQDISSSVLEIIKNGWGIITAEEQNDFNNNPNYV